MYLKKFTFICQEYLYADPLLISNLKLGISTAFGFDSLSERENQHTSMPGDKKNETKRIIK